MANLDSDSRVKSAFRMAAHPCSRLLLRLSPDMCCEKLTTSSTTYFRSPSLMAEGSQTYRDKQKSINDDFHHMQRSAARHLLGVFGLASRYRAMLKFKTDAVAAPRKTAVRFCVPSSPVTVLDRKRSAPCNTMVVHSYRVWFVSNLFDKNCCSPASQAQPVCMPWSHLTKAFPPPAPFPLTHCLLLIFFC